MKSLCSEKKVVLYENKVTYTVKKASPQDMLNNYVYVQ